MPTDFQRHVWKWFKTFPIKSLHILFFFGLIKTLKGMSEIYTFFFPRTMVARSQTHATLSVTDKNMSQLWTPFSMMLIHWRKALISLKIPTLLLHHILLQVFTKKWQLPFTLQTRLHDGGAEKQQLHISNWLFWDRNSHRCTVWLSYWWCLPPTLDKLRYQR